MTFAQPPEQPQAEAFHPPAKNKGGRPRGSKNKLPRRGHPSPMKNLSKYSGITKPVGIKQSDWDFWGDRRKQAVVKADRINHTDEGASARIGCGHCRREGLVCRFWRQHRSGRVCGNCEVKGRQCYAGERAAEEEEEAEEGFGGPEYGGGLSYEGMMYGGRRYEDYDAAEESGPQSRDSDGNVSEDYGQGGGYMLDGIERYARQVMTVD
ncbi:hypothetical protein LTR36_001575 [Oleoguttula mirabilis]|uniref:Zn(2)-C6 fungal-type domain-containing protein n=1 Tax=Oleoguttula mirabilis TaxID=1507867 RepID=A0AAV9JNB1_9PEZI|nr:hypothetical protein LTR36_001575 [Oleoguttula mirabilis]